MTSEFCEILDRNLEKEAHIMNLANAKQAKMAITSIRKALLESFVESEQNGYDWRKDAKDFASWLSR